MVGDLGDFLLKQEEVGEQEREDLVMWLHQVSAVSTILIQYPYPYASAISLITYPFTLKNLVSCRLPFCSSAEKRKLDLCCSCVFVVLHFCV